MDSERLSHGWHLGDLNICASTFPIERLNIDSMGPLKEDERGNKYIIAIIDCFTRWIGLYPVRDVNAECAVDALIEHFGIFGCPAQLISDNGSQFVNHRWDKMI